MNKITACVFLLLSLITLRAAAASMPSFPSSQAEEASQQESQELLKTEQYDVLDRKMNGIQHAYDSGSLGEGRLLHEFRAFYDINPALEANYNEWIEQRPKSYAAYLARGIYYKRRGV